MSRVLCHGLAALLVLTGSAPAWAHERPVAHSHGNGDDAGTVYASVEADASGVADAGPSMQKRIVERAGLVMHESGILPARNRDDATVRVEVDDLEGKVIGYSYEVWVEQHGAVVGPRAKQTCAACSETELLDAVVGAVEHALAGIEPVAAESEADGDAGAGPPEGVGDPVGPTEPTTDEGNGRLGTMGKAGIGLLVGGGVVLVTGIGLAVPQPKPLPDRPLYQRSLRPPGFALLGVGAAAAVTGAVLLAVDRKRGGRTAVAPAVGPAMTGVVWSGRF